MGPNSPSKTDETGLNPKKMPTDDLIEVGIFGACISPWKAVGRPIYFRKHHFFKPKTIIEIVVDKEPKVVVLDPYSYLLDGDQSNNEASF